MNMLLYRLLCGFLIGVGCILPGVSGGVMAVSFGLYQPMLEAITGFFRDAKKHLIFLLPLGTGGLIGMAFCSGGLARAMNQWETPMLFLFLGLILGSVPALWRNALTHGFRWQYLWALLPGALLLIGMLCLDEPSQQHSLSPVQWLLTGGVYALGTVIPGLSASFLLIRLGWYRHMLEMLSRVALPESLLFAAGFLIVTLLLLRSVKILFDRYPAYAAFGVLGLLAASVIPAIPALESGAAMLRDLLMLGFGVTVSLLMERLSQKTASPQNNNP